MAHAQRKSKVLSYLGLGDEDDENNLEDELYPELSYLLDDNSNIDFITHGDVLDTNAGLFNNNISFKFTYSKKFKNIILTLNKDQCSPLSPLDPDSSAFFPTSERISLFYIYLQS